MAKIKHFTDSDLDGVTCEILVKAAYDEENVNCQMSSPKYIDTAIKSWIEKGNNQFFEKVYITDLSINEETAKILDGTGMDIVLLDHHDSQNKVLSNMYDWYHVNTKFSGGMLTYYWLCTEFSTNKLNPLINFTKITEAYDLWTWQDQNLQLSKTMNDYYYLIGRDDFVNRFLSNPSIEFNNAEKYLLDITKRQEERYIIRKIKQAKIMDISVGLVPYRVAVVFGEDHPNEVCHTILENDKNSESEVKLNAVLFINMNSVSVRSDDGESAQAIARSHGGDGHPDSSGFAISESTRESIINYIFKSTEVD